MRAYNDMSQIKTYHDMSMSTGFIFVQKDFLVRLRSCSLIPCYKDDWTYVPLKKPLSMKVIEHTVGEQSAEQASIYFVH